MRDWLQTILEANKVEDSKIREIQKNLMDFFGNQNIEQFKQERGMTWERGQTNLLTGITSSIHKAFDSNYDKWNISGFIIVEIGKMGPSGFWAARWWLGCQKIPETKPDPNPEKTKIMIYYYDYLSRFRKSYRKHYNSKS